MIKLKHILNSLLSLCFILFLSSCGTYNKINIDVLQPSTYAFPEPVNQIVVHNNAKEQASNVGHTNYKSTINYNNSNPKKKKIKEVNIKVDSTITTCLDNVNITLNSTGLFTKVLESEELKNTTIAPYNSYKFFKSYDVEAILVLERLTYQDNYTLLTNKIYGNEEYEVEVIVKSNWSLYFSEKPAHGYPFEVSNTLYWNEKDADRTDCILQTVNENGYTAAQKISPYWEQVSRLYFTNISYVYKEIEEAIAQNDWTTAAKRWKAIYDSQRKDNKTKGRMAYNLALYFEMKNDFEASLSWLATADTLFTKTRAESEVYICQLYTKILNKRIINQKLIEQQFGL